MLDELARMLQDSSRAFEQRRTFLRVFGVLLGMIMATGRRTVTSALLLKGEGKLPWSANYLAFSRAEWSVDELFEPVVSTVLDCVDQLDPGAPLVIAIDDTSVRKTGKKIKAAGWMRDPLSPPFHVNLRYGLRFVHHAALLPLHKQGHDARAITVAFDLAPIIKRAAGKAKGKDKTPTEVEAISESQRKKHRLPSVAIERAKAIRKHLDENGHKSRHIALVVDGSYMNQTVFDNLPENVDIVGRIRKNAVLFNRAAPGGKRVYGDRLPTPEQIRVDDSIAWDQADIHYGGTVRPVRYKVVENVLWRGVAKRRPTRIIVIAPTPYIPGGRKGGKKSYREPAYLLTTDLVTPAEVIVQRYFDRWQIEVGHRELKQDIGVGQQQVWSNKAVARMHSALAAAWAMVNLAALRTQGLLRTEAYPERPAWYPAQEHDRASVRDIIALLRTEIANRATHPDNPMSAFPLPPCATSPNSRRLAA